MVITVLTETYTVFSENVHLEQVQYIGYFIQKSSAYSKGCYSQANIWDFYSQENLSHVFHN